MYKEHIAIFVQKPDQVFACGNVLPALYACAVMQNMKTFQNRIGMIINVFIFFQKTIYDIFSLFHPFQRRKGVVYSFNYRKNDLYADIKNGLFNCKSDFIYVAYVAASYSYNSFCLRAV